MFTFVGVAATAVTSGAVGTPADALQRAVAAQATGRIVVMSDNADRENETDLLVAAERVTAEQMAFLVRHTTGSVCAPTRAAYVPSSRTPENMTLERHAVHTFQAPSGEHATRACCSWPATTLPDEAHGGSRKHLPGSAQEPSTRSHSRSASASTTEPTSSAPAG